MPEVRHASQEVGADSAPTIVEAASNMVEQGKLDRLEKKFKAGAVDKGYIFQIIDSRGNILNDIKPTSLQDLVAQLQELREADID